LASLKVKEHKKLKKLKFKKTQKGRKKKEKKKKAFNYSSFNECRKKNNNRTQ
jgi:hypothetical protein